MRTAVALALALLTAGCGQSPDEKLKKDVEASVSWVATLQMAAEKWLSNSVPTRFVRATIGSAQKDFAKTKKTLEQSKASPDLRRTIRQQIEIADGAAAKLRAAIESGDRETAGIAVSQFAAAHDALEDATQ